MTLILPPDPLVDSATKIVHYGDWQRFVAEEPFTLPDRAGLERLADMTASERASFDAHRIAYVARTVCNTPFMEEVKAQLFPLLRMNRFVTNVPRAGVGLDGLGSYGKTTIALELGRQWERHLRTENGLPWGGEVMTPEGGLWIPVAFVTLSGETTERGVLESIADFYGIPARRRGTTNSSRLTALVNTMRAARTELLIIDDFHHLRPHSKSYDAASAFLKTITNQTNVTPLVAGVRLLEVGLFDEGEPGLRTPTAGRIARLLVGSFDVNDERGADVWQGLIEGFASTVLLARQKSGDLESLETYLYDRTSGVVGSLARLVRLVVTIAIETGAERITKGLLEQIPLDHAAEAARAARTSPTVSAGPSTRPKKRPALSGPTKLARRGRGVG